MNLEGFDDLHIKQLSLELSKLVRDTDLENQVLNQYFIGTAQFVDNLKPPVEPRDKRYRRDTLHAVKSENRSLTTEQKLEIALHESGALRVKMKDLTKETNLRMEKLMVTKGVMLG